MPNERDLTTRERWLIRHANPKFRVTSGYCNVTFTDGTAAIKHFERWCGGQVQPSLFETEVSA